MISSTEIMFIICLSGVLLILGAILSLIAKSSNTQEESLADKIEKILPGVQCAQCGYPGCSAYAQAVASQAAPCNKCIPGGPDTVKEIAALLGIDPPSEDNDDLIFLPRTVAIIDERKCTGCSKCVRHCPVDAIEGKIKTPHKVNSEECIGCGDCVKVCPERCIRLESLKPTTANFNWDIKAVVVTGETK